MSQQPTSRRSDDHRLRQLVQASGDIELAIRHGVPRSTARGWLHSPAREVVTCDLATVSLEDLRNEVLALRRRNERLLAILRLLVVLVKTLGISLEGRRVADGAKKKLLLRAIDRSRAALPLRRMLRVLKLSSSRYHDWRREEACALDDVPSCPHVTPQQITLEERQTMKEMATSREYRHVSTGTLAILAQRLGRVFASTSTWYRFIRRYGWRRPRRRVHPKKPTLGVRASKANEIWHIDTTVIRLLNGARSTCTR
jgi:putative transposase